MESKSCCPKEWWKQVFVFSKLWRKWVHKNISHQGVDSFTLLSKFLVHRERSSLTCQAQNSWLVLTNDDVAGSMFPWFHALCPFYDHNYPMVGNSTIQKLLNQSFNILTSCPLVCPFTNGFHWSVCVSVCVCVCVYFVFSSFSVSLSLFLSKLSHRVYRQQGLLRITG